MTVSAGLIVDLVCSAVSREDAVAVVESYGDQRAELAAQEAKADALLEVIALLAELKEPGSDVDSKSGEAA